MVMSASLRLQQHRMASVWKMKLKECRAGMKKKYHVQWLNAALVTDEMSMEKKQCVPPPPRV